MRFIPLASAAMLAALTTACALGPDFERPAAPAVSGYDSAPLPAATESAGDKQQGSQAFAAGQDIPAEWWTLFHSDDLDKLIAQALKNNPDIAAAQASLRAAQEDTAAGEGILYPTVTGDFSTTRQKTAGSAFGGSFPSQLYTLHNATVSVSYGLDIWGGSRREIEELTAEEDYQRFQLEAAYLTLTTNVVTAAVQEASLRGQIEATKNILANETRQLSLLREQLQLGGVAKTAVLAQEATLAQFRATLPPLQKQLAQVRHQLSALLGQTPDKAPEAEFTLTSITLPDTLPVSLPSKLVEQRPDIRAAEDNMHAASAAIGVAEVNRLPQITLSADIGSAATNLGKLFTPGTGLWSMGFDVSQTLFDAGTLAHKQGSAEAQYDAAAAQYRKTVLTAFQDVADTLRALQEDAITLRSENEAERAASGSLQLTREQYKEGSVGYVALLSAEQTEQQTRLALVQAQAQRYADTAALFQALGGGWWNRQTDITKSDTTDTADAKTED